VADRYDDGYAAALDAVLLIHEWDRESFSCACGWLADTRPPGQSGFTAWRAHIIAALPIPAAQEGPCNHCYHGVAYTPGGCTWQCCWCNDQHGPAGDARWWETRWPGEAHRHGPHAPKEKP
jgi:hypothetical protein